MSQFSDDVIIPADPADVKPGPPKRMVPMAVLGIVLAIFLLSSTLFSLPAVVMVMMGQGFGPEAGGEMDLPMRINSVQMGNIPLVIFSLSLATAVPIYLLMGSILVLSKNDHRAFWHYWQSCRLGFAVCVFSLVATAIMQAQVFQVIFEAEADPGVNRTMWEITYYVQIAVTVFSALYLLAQFIYLGLGWAWAGQILAEKSEPAPTESFVQS